MINSENKLKSTFITGDDWLYYKLYTGPSTLDNILIAAIGAITDILVQTETIDKWFFIRYSDPNEHLRLRFHVKDKKNLATVIETVHEHINPYVENGLIWKVQTDTYQREIDRYGEKSMEFSESIFFHDSSMIVEMLDKLEGDEGECFRWIFTLKSTDKFLDLFNFDIHKKLSFFEMLKTNFGKEFGMDRQLKAQIDDKFREERELINETMQASWGAEYDDFFAIIDKHLIKIKPYAEKILSLEKRNDLTLSLANLLSSYIHMHFNRLFKSQQRIHEMVIYDFLYRYYRSEIAKMKYARKL